MSKDIRGDQKHLTLSDRIYIEQALIQNENFRSIAKHLSKDPTTISLEIRKFLEWEEGRYAKDESNDCAHYSSCELKHLCIYHCAMQCRDCRKNRCTNICDNYEPLICNDLKSAPFVCNGCKERGNGCHLAKKLYDAECAHKDYKTTLSESRAGISLTESELNFIADTVIPLIKNGVSLPVAYSAYADRMPVSERTLYDYIDKGVFDAGNLDLHRKVRRKSSRQKSGPVLHVDKKCHVGRTYADFLAYLEDHPRARVSEMDTVEGTKGGKVILTNFFRDCSLHIQMYGFLPSGR